MRKNRTASQTASRLTKLAQGTKRLKNSSVRVLRNIFDARFFRKLSVRKTLPVVLSIAFTALFLGVFIRSSLWPREIPSSARPLSFSQEWEAFSLPFEMPPIRLFAFPDRICSIDAYGAIGDGETSNTRAIAAAIDDCASQGGGTVIIPTGRWVTGPIHLKSDIRLDVREGAEILFSQNSDEYLPVVFSRYEGMEYYNYSPLIYARDCHDIAITGKGILNGRGEAWWIWSHWRQTAVKRLYVMSDAGTPVEKRVFGTKADGLRPSFIQFVNCTRIELQGVTVKNGPMWTIHPVYSDNILIRDVTVTTEGPNTDGVVIDSSQNVIVENIRLDTADDAIAIKSGLDKEGRRIGIPSENIVVKDCHIGRGNGGVVIGSEMSGGVRNVFVSHCDFDGTKRGLRVKSAPGRGGIVENIWMEDIEMKNIRSEAILLNMFYDSKNVISPTTTDLPVFRNFFFKNIECSQANDAVSIIGADNSFIQNLSFENIRIRSENGIDAKNIDGMRFENFDIQAKNRPSISLYDIQNAIFGNPGHLPTYRPFVVIGGSRSENIRFGNAYPLSAIRLGKGVPKTALSRDGE